jgi:hypothetical protein
MNMWEKFVEAVGRHFRFLETEFGFTHKTPKLPNIIYESDSLQVQVYYDADGRHELDLGIRRLGDDLRKPLSVGIGMLMRLKDGPNTQGYQSPFPFTDEALEIEVKRLAELLRKYGSAVLSSDPRDFDRIEQVENELAKKFGTPPQSKPSR